jgi:hypothetical protein
MNSTIIQWTVVLFAAVFQARTLAATFTLEPDADARIIDIPGPGFPNANYETDILSVYTAAANVQRTLMRFDLSGVNLPLGERVSAAVLSMVASTGYGASEGQPMEVYRVIAPWNEKGLTWLSRDTGVLWSVPGGDSVGLAGSANASPYAISTDQPTTGQRISWVITALVDEWLEGNSPNNGLLLKSYPGNGLTFVQSESLNVNARPKLTVTTAPGPPRLRAESMDAGQVRLSWRGANVGVLEENELASSAGWLQSGAVPTVVNGRTQVAVQTGGTRKFYRVRGE